MGGLEQRDKLFLRAKPWGGVADVVEHVVYFHVPPDRRTTLFLALACPFCLLGNGKGRGWFDDVGLGPACPFARQDLIRRGSLSPVRRVGVETA
eukprot:4741836-Pyramimonas_sp.AAC.1